MSSPSKPRKARSNKVSIDIYNTDKRKHNIEREINISMRKMNKLLKRFANGLPRVPGRKCIWDDSKKNIIKIISLPKKQGYPVDGERHQKALRHLEYLKQLLLQK